MIWPTRLVVGSPTAVPVTLSTGLQHHRVGRKKSAYLYCIVRKTSSLPLQIWNISLNLLWGSGKKLFSCLGSETVQIDHFYFAYAKQSVYFGKKRHSFSSILQNFRETEFRWKSYICWKAALWTSEMWWKLFHFHYICWWSCFMLRLEPVFVIN